MACPTTTSTLSPMNVQDTQVDPQSAASIHESMAAPTQMASSTQESSYPQNTFDEYSINNTSNHSETRASPSGSLSDLKNTLPATTAMGMLTPSTFDRATTASPVGAMLGQHHEMFRTSTEPTRMSSTWLHGNTNHFTQSPLISAYPQQQRRQINHAEQHNDFVMPQQAQAQLGIRPRAKTAGTSTSWNAQNPAYRASGLRNETSFDSFYGNNPVDVKPELDTRTRYECTEPRPQSPRADTLDSRFNAMMGEDPLKFLYDSPSSENSDATSMTPAFTGAREANAGSNLASFGAMNHNNYIDNIQQFAYNTSPGMMNYSENSHQYSQQMLQHMARPLVPLRSHLGDASLSPLSSSTPRATTIVSNSPSVIAKPRRRSRYSKQYSEEMEDEIDVAMEDDDDASGCHYSSIEAAKAAERPPIKVKPEKDKTIPTTDAKRQEYVRQMVRCMVFTGKAQDNHGMIQQWRKMKQDIQRVEQAAWRMLEMTLQMHEHGIPMLASKAPSNRYANMKERWDAICRGLMVSLLYF